MELWYAGADKRPLSSTQTEPPIQPRILVFHTMAGYLRGTDSWFRRDGFDGVESHFGVGGSSDQPEDDGRVFQWQALDRQADAQANGNSLATSVETSDGGDSAQPWSRLQLASLVGLTVWWAGQTGNPIVLATGPKGRGIGYHSQFSEWNPSRHACPGRVRLSQLLTKVLPTAQAIQAGGVHPETRPALRRVLRSQQPMLQGADVAMVQNLVRVKPDGWYGPDTVRAVKSFQKARGLVSDGIVGPTTATALGLLWLG